MTYVNPKTLYSVGKAANTLYNYGRKAYSAYSLGSQVYNAIRPHLAASKPVTVKRTTKAKVKSVKRLFKRTTKAKKVAKLVGSIPRKSVYSKKSKKMRRFNKGKLSLQTRLQAGQSLPNTTFAKLFWRGSMVMSMISKNPGAPNNNSYTGPTHGRTLCLNDISQSPSFNSNIDQEVTYAPMWQSLYEKFLVLGSKCKIKINPAFYPSTIQSSTNDIATYDSRVPVNAQPGYWYVRCYYERGSEDQGTGSEIVGHPILYNDINDPMSENWWPSLREFLSDPTVTFKKDPTQLRTKLHLHSAGNLYDGTTTAQSTVTDRFSYEIETNTKPVTLSVNFSCKKHFEDKNPLRNRPFTTWDQQLADPYRFKVRFGYIGFDSTGKIAYHVPIDRNQNRFVELEVEYFVAFRDPKITPHMTVAQAQAAMFQNTTSQQEKNIQPYEEDPSLTAMLDL